jgi:rubredoxin
MVKLIMVPGAIAMARYECPVCGYVYDDEQEGVAWDNLPDDWVCPGCGSAKSLFISSPASQEETAVTARIAGREPMEVTLEKGEYHWCACGLGLRSSSA